MNPEGFQTYPLRTLTHIDLHIDGPAEGSSGQCVPLILGRTGLDALAQHLLSAADSEARNGLIDTLQQFETEGCDIAGHGDVGIVGVDDGGHLADHEVLGQRRPVTGGQEQER